MSRQTTNRLPQKERRAFWRTAVLWAGHLHVDGGSAECVVLDISANGAKLRFRDPAPGDENTCALEVPRLGVLSCVVTWRRGNRIGLRFSEGLANIKTRMPAVLPQARAIS